jgi:hypothetical protein
MRAVCPREGCDYIAFGDNDKELRRDMRYQFLNIHNSHDLPERIEDLDEFPSKL